MPAYPARLIPDGNGSVVLVLPDVPEVVVKAATEDEAFERAEMTLNAVLAAYRVRGKPYPTPSVICGAPVVESEAET